MDEKMKAVLQLMVAGTEIIDACRLCGYEDPMKAASDFMKDETFMTGLEDTPDPQTDVLLSSPQARKRFWAKVMKDKDTPVKERLRASELLSKASGDFVDKLDVTFSPKKLLDALEANDQ